MFKDFFKNHGVWLIFSCLFAQTAYCDIEIKTKGGVGIAQLPGPCYAFNIGSLIHIDETVFSGSTYDKQGQFQNGAILRRLYLEMDGTLSKNWSYNLHTSFESIPPNNSIGVILRDVFLNYAGFENANLQFGQVGIPSSLENWGFNSDLFFIDNSLPVGTFFPDNDFGIGVYADKTFFDTFMAAAAVYQPRQDLNYNGQVGLGKADRLNEALRITFSPLHKPTAVVHFGIWGRHEAYNYSFRGAAIPSRFCFQGYNDEPEAEARNTGSLIDTGPIRNKYNMLSGIEVAGICGPFMIQGEYMGSRVRQMYSNEDPAIFLNNALWFYGWYVQGSYVITGESHRYDFPLGLFRRPEPAHCYGAWEIVARYSAIDLSDKNIIGGVEHDVSLGLNWYVNNVVRLCANYVRASAHASLSNPNGANNNYGKRKLNIFAARIQIAF